MKQTIEAARVTTPSDREIRIERGGHWRFVEHGPDGVHDESYAALDKVLAKLG